VGPNVLQMETIHILDYIFPIRQHLMGYEGIASLWKARHLMDSNGIRDSEQTKLSGARNVIHIEWITNKGTQEVKVRKGHHGAAKG